MLIWPSRVRNTPVGMLVGWSLPACSGTSRAISQRAAWKSSIAICAASSELSTHWPWPETSRSKQRDENAHRAEDPGRQIGDRNADAHRPLPRQAGNRHQPAHALRDLVEARAVAIRPALPETGDAGVDQARVDRLQRLVVDAKAGFHVGPVVLDHDIRARAPACGRSRSPPALSDRASGCACCGAGSGNRGRDADRRALRPGPGGASILITSAPQSASWRTAVGPGANAGQVEHLEPGKRQRGRIGHGNLRSGKARQILEPVCRKRKRAAIRPNAQKKSRRAARGGGRCRGPAAPAC